MLALAVVLATLACALTAASASAETPQEVASGGGVNARLFYAPSADGFHPTRIEIVRDGETVLNQRLDPRCAGCVATPVGSSNGRPSLYVHDFDGDGEPEVSYDYSQGGAVCCGFTRVWVYGGAEYYSLVHNWGDQDPPQLRDLRGNGEREWLSGDSRIRYVFGCGACAPYPIQIWAFRDGDFTNVTRTYPRRIRGDARANWSRYRSGNKYGRRGALAAWAADEYLLRHRKLVARTVAAALRHGRLGLAGAFDFGPTGRAYIRTLRRWLARNGY